MTEIFWKAHMISKFYLWTISLWLESVDSVSDWENKVIEFHNVVCTWCIMYAAQNSSVCSLFIVRVYFSACRKNTKFSDLIFFLHSLSFTLLWYTGYSVTVSQLQIQASILILRGCKWEPFCFASCLVLAFAQRGC